MTSRRNPLYDTDEDAPRPRCTIRGCRKVIGLREAQIMVCDEHAMQIWAHVQRYNGDPDFLDAAVVAYEQKLQNEAWADKERTMRGGNPRAEDIRDHFESIGMWSGAFTSGGDGPTVPEFEDIYYVRQGDLIKIGYSTRLYDRLFAYGPTVEVLAHHPGTRADERDLHRTFRPFLAHGREWYNPAGVLLDHIAAVIAKYGEPTCIPEWSTPKAAPHSMRRSSQAKPTGLSI